MTMTLLVWIPGLVTALSIGWMCGREFRYEEGLRDGRREAFAYCAEQESQLVGDLLVAMVREEQHV
jgi:hypothetical protein